MNSVEDKLKELKLELPVVGEAVGNYVPYVQVGNLLYLSGVICMKDGAMVYEGKVGSIYNLEEGYEAARFCGLNTLGVIKKALGNLDKVKRIVFMTGYVNAVDGFSQIPEVVNGASDLFVAVLGERGKHARAAVAVAGLPKNTTVELQCVLEV